MVRQDNKLFSQDDNMNARISQDGIFIFLHEEFFFKWTNIKSVLTRICKDGVVSTVVGKPHPCAKSELVQFGQRLLVLNGSLMLECVFVGCALLLTSAKLI